MTLKQKMVPQDLTILGKVKNLKLREKDKNEVEMITYKYKFWLENKIWVQRLSIRIRHTN